MKGVDGLRRPCQCLIDHGVVNAPPFVIVGRYRWPLFTSSRSSGDGGGVVVSAATTVAQSPGSGRSMSGGGMQQCAAAAVAAADFWNELNVYKGFG
uniref:Uncharacterized protein n=1 Tax=Oryza barthii TaxID=65489 RepID=A0A0D3H4S5_9ORYZ